MRRTLFLLLVSAATVCAQKRPFDVAAMMELKRIADPQISPDGLWVTFTVQTVDVAANKKPQQIWIVPLTGGAPRQLTQDGEANQRARWIEPARRAKSPALQPGYLTRSTDARTGPASGDSSILFQNVP